MCVSVAVAVGCAYLTTPVVLQLAAKAKAARIARLQRRYHKVKFFERKKVMRKLKGARKRLAQVRM